MLKTIVTIIRLSVKSKGQMSNFIRSSNEPLLFFLHPRKVFTNFQGLNKYSFLLSGRLIPSWESVTKIPFVKKTFRGPFSVYHSLPEFQWWGQIGRPERGGKMVNCVRSTGDSKYRTTKKGQFLILQVPYLISIKKKS